MKLTFV